MLKRVILWAMLMPLAGAAGAQMSLPQLGSGLGTVLGRVDSALSPVTRPVEGVLRDATTLATARLDRLTDFVRTHRGAVEMDDSDQPARAHEILLLDPDDAVVAQAGAAGCRLIERGQVEGLGIAYARLSTPDGKSLAAAIRQLRRLLPGRTISADQLHFPGGSTARTRTTSSAARPTGGTVGIIDSGALPGPRIAAQAGFAQGAPRAGEHGQAIASLLNGAGVARIYVADVYGNDPAGGNALAIARALGWMAGRGVGIVSISLVGPANPLLERAIGAAQARGMIVAAAVGNDGAAAPPAYPASYRDVLAVTGVDGHGRVLFEAGRATHLDYGAPGADMMAIGLGGKPVSLRGTSFAAPLAAARVAALSAGVQGRGAVLLRADAEAVKGGHTGRGVLCPACRAGV